MIEKEIFFKYDIRILEAAKNSFKPDRIYIGNNKKITDLLLRTVLHPGLVDIRFLFGL